MVTNLSKVFAIPLILIIGSTIRKCRVHMSDSYMQWWNEVHHQFRHYHRTCKIVDPVVFGDGNVYPFQCWDCANWDNGVYYVVVLGIFCVKISTLSFTVLLSLWMVRNEKDNTSLLFIYSISQEICTRFLLCCALLWLYIDWFSHIHQAYFTGTVAI